MLRRLLAAGFESLSLCSKTSLAKVRFSSSSKKESLPGERASRLVESNDEVDKRNQRGRSNTDARENAPENSQDANRHRCSLFRRLLSSAGPSTRINSSRKEAKEDSPCASPHPAGCLPHYNSTVLWFVLHGTPTAEAAARAPARSRRRDLTAEKPCCECLRHPRLGRVQWKSFRLRYRCTRAIGFPEHTGRGQR